LWTNSGNYIDTIPNDVGCDSLVNIDLTIHQSTLNSFFDTACYSYTSPNGNDVWTQTGVYYDTLQSVFGCDSIVEINLTLYDLDAYVVDNNPVFVAYPSGSNYQWLDCDNHFSALNGEVSQVFTATSIGNYAVAITQNGCIDTSSCYAVSTVDIFQNEFENELTIFPNPTDGTILIDLGGTYSHIKVSVFDASGKLINTMSHNNINQFPLCITGKPGLYVVDLELEEAEKISVNILKTN
jgi:hypothetical protein